MKYYHFFSIIGKTKIFNELKNLKKLAIKNIFLYNDKKDKTKEEEGMLFIMKSNVKMNKKNSKGITLIALIVSIIVMLILAGVTIVTLTGDGGLLGRANAAVLAHKKSEYFEDIKFEAGEEQIERASQQKEEAFITSLANRLSPQKKDWVSAIIKCTDDFDEKENDYENNLLLITTKEDYEIYVDVNNGNLVATIREGSFSKAGKDSIVTYDKNTGTGTMENQSIKTGFYMTLSENTFTKTNYSFVGWCKDKDGVGEKYASGSKLKIEEDTTLYAIWSQDVVTITYYANGGTGEMETTEVGKGDSINIASNTFTRNGYIFDKWNTQADKSGTEYENNDTITANDYIELYAQWKQVYNILYNGNGSTSGEMASESVTAGETITLANNQYQKENNEFDGWNTQADGNGTSYANLASITPNGNITLYAMWTGAHVTSISLSDTSKQLNIGESYTLNVNYSPTNLKEEKKGITWTSSDTSVATITDGVVKAVWTGTCTITATSTNNNAATATCTINVAPVSTSSPNYGTAIQSSYTNIYSNKTGSWTSVEKASGSDDNYNNGNYKVTWGILSSFMSEKNINGGNQGYHVKNSSMSVIKSGNNNPGLTQEVSNRWVAFYWHGGSMTTSTYVSNINLVFKDGNSYNISESVSNGYIEPLVLVGSASWSTSYRFTNTYNTLTGGATSTTNYPCLLVFAKIKNKSPLTNITFTSNKTWGTSNHADGFRAFLGKEGFEYSTTN